MNKEEQEIPLSVVCPTSTARITEVCPSRSRRRRGSSSSSISSCSSTASSSCTSASNNIDTCCPTAVPKNLLLNNNSNVNGGGKRRASLKRTRSSQKKRNSISKLVARQLVEDALLNIRNMQESARYTRQDLHNDRDEALLAIQEVKDFREELKRQLQAHYCE